MRVDLSASTCTVYSLQSTDSTSTELMLTRLNMHTTALDSRCSAYALSLVNDLHLTCRF